MPHESTVNPNEHVSDDYGNLRRGRCSTSESVPNGLTSSSMSKLTEQAALTRVSESNKPEAPMVLTHDDFDDDEDSDESK